LGLENTNFELTEFELSDFSSWKTLWSTGADTGDTSIILLLTLVPECGEM
jgi:hypothetical protein